MNEKIRVGDRVTIYPRGKKGIYCADFWHQGKHRRSSLKTRNRKVAEQRAVQLTSDLLEGKFKTAPPPMMIDDAVEKYLEYLKLEGRARKTISRYRSELSAWQGFLNSLHITRLSQITIPAFDQFRTHRREQGRAPQSMLQEAVLVKQWLKWCCLRNWLSENPLAGYKLAKPRVERRGGPNLEQVDQILAAFEEPARTLCAMLAFTGMRSGELERLRQEDIDFDGNWIHIVSREGAETKTRHSRKVPIHARLRPILEAVPRGESPWFFTAEPSKEHPHRDRPINTRRLNGRFVGLMAELKLPAGRDRNGFTLHSLRHFFETFCTNSGIPQRVVDTWLGHHSDQSMGSIYYKLSDEESQQFMVRVPFGTHKAASDAA